MQTKPLPEIADSDLKAVREFLTSLRDGEQPGRSPRQGPAPAARGIVPLSNGISRARMRSAIKARA